MPHRISVGPLGTNVYIEPLGDGTCVVFDPGAEPDAIAGELGRLGLRPVLVALTHGHLDHTAALPALARRYSTPGSDLPVAIHEADRAYLGAAAETTNRRLFADIGASGYFRAYFEPMPEPSFLLEDGGILPGTGIAVIHTPGHTAGSVCFLLPSGDLISGDTLFKDGIGRTDCFDSDQDAIVAGIERKLLVLPPATRVHPGHGESTTIGAEARHFRHRA